MLNKPLIDPTVDLKQHYYQSSNIYEQACAKQLELIVDYRFYQDFQSESCF